jgi:hypothetical protein
LRDALRDWAAGCAFFRDGRFWITDTHGRAKVAPWNKPALAAYSDTTGLKLAAESHYPGASGSSRAQRERRAARRAQRAERT